MKDRQGLTLIELIVVIAIITILMSLVVGYAWQTRESAKVLACQSNLSQIGRAILAYSSLEGGYMPGGQIGSKFKNSTALVTSLLPYRHIVPYIVPDKDLEQLASSIPPAVFKCPSDELVYGEKHTDGVGYRTSYLYNTIEMTSGTVIDSESANGIRYVDSANKTKPRLREFFENNANWKDGINDPAHQEVCIDWTPLEEGQTITSYRHYKKLGYEKEGSNVLFLDGRVEFVPANPTDIIFETGFEIFEDANPLDEAVKDRYWVRWIARKY